MKPAKLVRAIMPMGNTECGSAPKTARNRKYGLNDYGKGLTKWKHKTKERHNSEVY